MIAIAGIKSGAISAISAGLSYGVNDALGLNAQLDEAGNAITKTQVVTDANGATSTKIITQYGNEAATTRCFSIPTPGDSPPLAACCARHGTYG